MGGLTTRRYTYTLESDGARSSGVVSVEPRYDYQYTAAQCAYYSRSSVSKVPLGDGPTVGYREVTVSRGASGEYGKTRHTFRSVIDAADLVMDTVLPHSPATSNAWRRGQQTSATERDASGKLQQRTSTAYAFRTSVADSAKSLRAMAINTFSAGTLGSDYYYSRYELGSFWAHPASDSTIIYNEMGTSSVSSRNSYTYGNPAHLQPTKVVETNSDGTQRITRLKYPADYGSGSGDVVAIALTAMRGSAHIHSPVIERWVSEVVGSSERVLEAELNSNRCIAGRMHKLENPENTKRPPDSDLPL